MLFDELKKYSAGGVYPMHMPGHKRNPEYMPPGLPYDIDITEIDGFDDLHNPNGLLLETSELAAKLYDSVRVFPLVNGSTVGLLAGIGAHASRGDKILITRNCHRSVENAAALFGLSPIYVRPETDVSSGVLCSVDPGAVDEALAKNPDTKLVVVTSPSYEGVVSDIHAIAGVVHRRGIPLLVDSAHGAHLGFSPNFPAGPVRAGADVVVMSLHKTLPALTQCSLLHICGGYANAAKVKRLLSVLQTSSPSYVLMASIDHCLRLLISDSDRLFNEYEQKLEQFAAQIRPLKNLWVLSKTPHAFFGLDPGKIVIITKNTALSGAELANVLRGKYKIEPELACDRYVIAMTSVCDSAGGFSQLAEALLAIDGATDGAIDGAAG